jgi:hypothetical protein
MHCLLDVNTIRHLTTRHLTIRHLAARHLKARHLTTRHHGTFRRHLQFDTNISLSIHFVTITFSQYRETHRTDALKVQSHEIFDPRFLSLNGNPGSSDSGAKAVLNIDLNWRSNSILFFCYIMPFYFTAMGQVWSPMTDFLIYCYFHGSCKGRKNFVFDYALCQKNSALCGIVPSRDSAPCRISPSSDSAPWRIARSFKKRFYLHETPRYGT